MGRVLLIDDSLTVASVVGDLLRDAGHDVAAIDSYAKLPASLTDFRPDAVVLDLVMPGVDGIQIARFIQRFSSSPPPIVLHSGSDRELVRAASREVKPFAVLSKTARPEEIVATIRAAVASGQRANAPIDCDPEDADARGREGGEERFLGVDESDTSVRAGTDLSSDRTHMT